MKKALVILFCLVFVSSACAGVFDNRKKSETEKKWEEQQMDNADPWDNYLKERTKDKPWEYKHRWEREEKKEKKNPWKHPPNPLDTWYWQEFSIDSKIRYSIGWEGISCYDWNWFVPVTLKIKLVKDLREYEGQRVDTLYNVFSIDCENSTWRLMKNAAYYNRNELVTQYEVKWEDRKIEYITEYDRTHETHIFELYDTICNKTCKGKYKERY